MNTCLKYLEYSGACLRTSSQNRGTLLLVKPGSIRPLSGICKIKQEINQIHWDWNIQSGSH